MGNRDAKKFLEESARMYHKDILKGWENLYSKKLARLFKVMKKYHISGNALELGCADGVMTERLFQEFNTLTVIDGSQLFIDQLKHKIKSDKLQTICSLFEEFDASNLH